MYVFIKLKCLYSIWQLCNGFTAVLQPESAPHTREIPFKSPVFRKTVEGAIGNRKRVEWKWFWGRRVEMLGILGRFRGGSPINRLGFVYLSASGFRIREKNLLIYRFGMVHFFEDFIECISF